MNDWYVGMRVVCIVDHWGEMHGFNSLMNILKNPVKGNVYTIRSIMAEGSYVGIRLVEIVNPIIFTGEPVYSTKGFRPVDETKLDQFRVHLNKQPELV